MRNETRRLVELDRERGIAARIGALLGWDQETYLPPKAVAGRAEQLAFAEALAHERATRPEIGELLAALGSTEAEPGGMPGLESAERAFLRVLRRQYDRALRLPADLVAEFARATSLAQAAWVDARSRDDFPAFVPHLERVVELSRRRAACLGPGRKAYDVLLDLFEPGSDEAGVRAVFAALRPELAALLGRIRSRPQVDAGVLRGRVPRARQEAISAWLMDELGFDRGRGRLDATAHPFTTTLGSDDVRITTRYDESFLPSSMFSTLHETGHALYELGIDPGPDYAGTALAESVSMAVHESQSRLWENLVGRSASFWGPRYGKLGELAGGALDRVGLEAFVAGVNKVEPSHIRVEADEVTYGLHVILRFELESALISGDLAPRDLPGAWREKASDLLGLVPPTDAAGCLQDVHWSAGLFGYFPSYLLGNLYAAQFWGAMRGERPGIEAELSKGEVGGLLAWLRERIHASGASFTPGELLERVTGAPLDPGRFVAYLGGKYAGIYGF